MSRPMRRGAGVVVAVAVTVLVGALSRVPYSADAGAGATLRLAWRVVSVRVQVCRHRSPEELAGLPAHMREDEVCERQVLPYRLRLVVDDRLVADDVIHAGGARQDRPLFVFHQLALEPGTHRVTVRFDRQGIAPVEPPEEHLEEHGDAGVSPPALTLDTTVSVSPREVLLVTYDSDARRLVVRGPDASISGRQ